MTGTPPSAGTADALKAKVKAWLDGEGYPFELRIGRELSARGWSASHAVYFQDLRTRKPRQIDIAAWKLFNPLDDGRGIHVELAIECKHAGGQVWVVFSSDAELSEKSSPSMYTPGWIGQTVLSYYEFSGSARQPLEWLNLAPARGHGIVRAMIKRTRGRAGARLDQAFAAVRTAISAAEARADELGTVIHADVFDIIGPTVCLPVVLFNGPLFDYRIDTDGTETLTEIGSARLVAPTPGDAQSMRVVNVVTPPALHDFLRRVERDIANLLDAVAPEWETLMSELKSQAGARQAR